MWVIERITACLRYGGRLVRMNDGNWVMNRRFEPVARNEGSGETLPVASRRRSCRTVDRVLVLSGTDTAEGELYFDVAGVVVATEWPLEFLVGSPPAIRTEKVWHADKRTPVLDDGVDAPRDCGSAYWFRQKLVRASVNGLLEVTQLGIGSHDNQRQMPNLSFWPLANVAAEFDAAEMG